MVQELFGGSNVGKISPAAAPPTPENLRCPRCDSSNTKFCYYNNYNLTQPRHFCKTCRRYWTKGGALRNVPIGGGCRKNKNAAVTPPVGKPKMKTASFDSNPVIWASSQNSHFLSLIRQNPVKEELSPASLFTPSHVSSDFHHGLDHMGLGLGPGPGPAHFLDQNNGLHLQEAYQRLRSTQNSCYGDHAPLILESSPVAAGEQFGLWNVPTLSWPGDSAYP